MTKKITLRAKSDGTVLFDLELVHEYRDGWNVRLAKNVTAAMLYKQEWELVPPPLPTTPGTVFRATVRGVENTLVMVLEGARVEGYRYCTPHDTKKACMHAAGHIDPASVVPLKIVEARR